MYAVPTYLEFVFQGEYTPPAYVDLIFADPSRPDAVISVAGKRGSFQGFGQHELAHTAVGNFLGKRGSFQGSGQHLDWPPYVATGAFVGKRGSMAASAFITLPIVSNPIGMHWTPPQEAEHAISQGWNGRQAAGRQAPRWGAGQQAQRAIHLDTGPAVATDGRSPIRWGTSSITARAAEAAYSAIAPLRVATSPTYGPAALRVQGAPGAWDAAILVRRPVLTGWTHATGQAGTARLVQTAAQFARQAWRVPWGAARWPALIWPPVVVVIPPPVDPTQYFPPAYCEFLFRGLYTPPGYSDILFGRIRGITIPSREVYIIVPIANLILISNSNEIPITGFTIAADVDSSYWRLSAQVIGRAAYQALQPTEDGPVQVQASTQGLNWNFLVDRLSGSVEFLAEAFSLTGRSACALLGAGWARQRTFTEITGKLRQQLALQEFDLTGWTLTPWNVADWLVPAKAWSYQGLTPMEALRRLADPDGFLLPHPTNETIGVYPRYKVLPWDWGDATPDLIIPADVVTSAAMEPRFSRDAGLGWNAVFVRGTSGGFWKVLRAGTLGDVIRDEALVESLMTHLDAARAWGGRWLADAEPLVKETLELPLAPTSDIPLVALGSLIEYSTPMGTYRGIVRDVEVSVSLSGAALVVMQKVTVERYAE